MQHTDKTILCESTHGKISVYNNAVAYHLTFGQIDVVLHGEQIHALIDTLEGLSAADWFTTPTHSFTFLHIDQLQGNFLLSEEEVADLLKLLREGAAMIKVHHKLFFKTTPRIN